MPESFDLLRTGKEAAFLAKIDSVDVHATDEHGRTLLHVAIARHELRAGHELIARGADINHPENKNGDTPLHVASEYGYLEFVQMLLAAGADPNKLEKGGNSPLWTATYWSRRVDKGIDIVKALLEAGSDPTHRNKHGKSPLSLAEDMDDEELFNLMTL
jgi:ankyrin repeat protein